MEGRREGSCSVQFPAGLQITRSCEFLAPNEVPRNDGLNSDNVDAVLLTKVDAEKLCQFASGSLATLRRFR